MMRLEGHRKPSGRCCDWRLRPKIALDGMSQEQRHGKTGMRLQMHLAKILGREPTTVTAP